MSYVDLDLTIVAVYAYGLSMIRMLYVYPTAR